MVDVYSKKKEPVRVPFDAEKINKLLGTDISKEEMIGYFKKIDLEFDEETSTETIFNFVRKSNNHELNIKTKHSK